MFLFFLLLLTFRSSQVSRPRRPDRRAVHLRHPQADQAASRKSHLHLRRQRDPADRFCVRRRNRDALFGEVGAPSTIVLPRSRVSSSRPAAALMSTVYEVQKDEDGASFDPNFGRALSKTFASARRLPLHHVLGREHLWCRRRGHELFRGHELSRRRVIPLPPNSLPLIKSPSRRPASPRTYISPPPRRPNRATRAHSSAHIYILMLSCLPELL